MCCTVDYLTAGGGRIDGTVDGDIAVEIEARKITQILGSLLKLLCHPYPKKLLLLLQANIDNPDLAQRQCNQILRKFLNQQDFRVILARGSGHDEHFEEDVTTSRRRAQHAVNSTKRKRCSSSGLPCRKPL